MNRINMALLVAPLSAFVFGVVACGSSDDPETAGTGGAGGLATGGGGATGGAGATTGGVTGAGGGPATGGAVATGGVTSGTGGAPAAGGAVATGGVTSGTGGAVATGGASGTGGGTAGLAKFSFFVTSLKAMQREANNPAGFGGDLRLGETGEGAGLRGADKLCTKIAETSMPGSGAKTWRAFLSARAAGPGGTVVHAKDRIGQGPWYDRRERLVASNLTDLINTRPRGADPAIIDDLPNEDGVPNHQPDPTQPEVDNHDILTGSTEQGTLYGSGMGPTCADWTSKVGSAGKPRVGHSWPRTGFPGGGGGFPGGGGFGDMANWMSALDEAGCAAGVNIIEMGPPNPANPTVGSGGGYGGIYCFALTP